MNDRILNCDDAGQLRDLAERLDRAWRTAENITDANPAATRKLREFTEQAGQLAATTLELANYAEALDEGRARHVTGIAWCGPGDKVQLLVPGEPEPLVTSIHVITAETGLNRLQVDGQELRFTVITSTETGDPVDTPTWFH